MDVSDQGFGEALARHRPYLLMLVRLSLGDRFRGKIDESGIVQDVLLAALQACDGPNACRGSDLLPWLRGILANKLANKVRAMRAAKRRGDLEVSLEDLVNRSSACLDAFLGATSPSPSAAMLEDERRLELSSALCKLPGRQQEAVVLHHLEGVPVSDVARRLKTTTAAVIGLLRRGRQQLREELKLLEQD